MAPPATTDRATRTKEVVLQVAIEEFAAKGFHGADVQVIADWPDAAPWLTDKVFSLVQAGLLQGKSIGFLPTKVHMPDDKEVEKHNWKGVACVIDEWILLEYACVFLPAQQNAVVESVSKGMHLPEDFQKALGIQVKALPAPRPPVFDDIPFTCLSTVERAIQASLNRIDPIALADRAAQDHLDRLRGRV